MVRRFLGRLLLVAEYLAAAERANSFRPGQALGPAFYGISNRLQPSASAPASPYRPVEKSMWSQQERLLFFWECGIESLDDELHPAIRAEV